MTAQVDRLSEEIKIFKNGSLIHSESFVSSEASHLIGENWSIGTGNLAYVIDETRLSSTARSADWIQACFDNQKVNPDFPVSSSGISGDHSFTSVSEFIIPAEQPFVHNLEATGSPSAFIASGLPPGLVLDPDPIDGNFQYS